jgi:hypothetical protein
MKVNKGTIYLLVDYRNKFYSSTREVAGSMNVAKLKQLFEDLNYSVCVEEFSQVNFSADKYRDAVVLYQSSEDPGLLYKSYIEDVLLGLQLIGARIVPGFPLFRAHHNKVFMEILRSVNGSSALNTVAAQHFGTLEELRIKTPQSFPVVVKSAAGSRSSGVQMARDIGELQRVVRHLSRSWSFFNIVRRLGNWMDGVSFKPISQHRNKYIVQQFVPRLAGDYKVLVYANRSTYLNARIVEVIFEPVAVVS